ncbi:hypothetical protein I3760_01G105200 [Carya illinoinensis]|nr:hypothetical protein I3760_01G105200 [Carya illinoinensis]KAG2726284.1 hypothetical protein I3760_01G105200 [Carya illinoinensis]
MAPFGKVFFSLLLSPPLPGVPPFPLFSLLPFSPYSPHAISVPTLNSLSFSLVPHSHLFLNIVSIRVVVTHCCLCRRVQSLSSTPVRVSTVPLCSLTVFSLPSRILSLASCPQFGFPRCAQPLIQELSTITPSSRR